MKWKKGESGLLLGKRAGITCLNFLVNEAVMRGIIIVVQDNCHFQETINHLSSNDVEFVVPF